MTAALLILIAATSLAIDLQAPLDEPFIVSSGFGFRQDPLGGRDDDMHKGIDLVPLGSTTVRAAAAGRVTIHYPPPGGRYKGHPVYGALIIIDHGAGILTLYGHMSRTRVQEGQLVSQGHPIGVVGATGLATGTHLHFEVLTDPASMIVNSAMEKSRKARLRIFSTK